MSSARAAANPLAFAHGPVRDWFSASFPEPTEAQRLAWPAIAEGRSVLLLAPTGSGKTLAAFLAALDRLMFEPLPERTPARTRVLYISPLKALGVDVERNLRAPLAGIAAVARRSEVAHRRPSVGVRSGDTPPAERARLRREPPDILITTPESLYLMLTSRAGETLAAVETVIVDEIHTMAASKRGSHLFLSLERLETLRNDASRPLQRIGLSATQRPLEEIARLLGGATLADDGTLVSRPVEIVNAGRTKALELTVEVPVEDMADPGAEAEIPSGAAAAPVLRSIWPSIHTRLLEHIRAHRSTMLFVNSRRLAERLAGALNELAGEEVALAHHGSVARDRRLAIEDRLKRGELPAIVATSSLELGIDMGAVDLVIQIEAPPSIASGVQRVGRAGHDVGRVSKGVIFPKHRGDLLACAAATVHMRRGEVEATHYPRNPLDVLAQHVVAMVAMGTQSVNEVYDLVRRAAPFAELPRRSFEGVLDMLSGRYPTERFAQFRARVTWDRLAGTLHARAGAQTIAIVNAGTIPDRGLYGVFLAGAEAGRPVRVGELDEEMVFEARAGDVFLLGASSWRIEEITHDRVLVSPAPGQQSRMPFWRGDSPGRPLDFGRAIGQLARTLVERDPAEATRALCEEHGLDELAAANLLAYLEEQGRTSEVPTDRTVVLERFIDDVGDWRVLLLSPFGGRSTYAPWSTAILARLREERGIEVDSMWSDDGIVFRLPESDRPPDEGWFIPGPHEVESLVTRHLADTPLFAARFRENAARALLLPRKRPGERTPLWVQRRRSADLLAAAAEFSDFPVLLETYRDCLRDVFDMPGLVGLMEDVAERRIRVRTVDVRVPSPFAASLLYTWVAQFLYEGDAPLAERRAQALSLDHAQLRELLGEPELRELLDPESIEAVALRLQRIDGRAPLEHADGVHDLLLQLGPLGRDEIEARAQDRESAGSWLESLMRERRIFEGIVAGERRFAAAEDAGLLRDALGLVPPPGLPSVFVDPVERALDRLVERHARTHGPFTAGAVAERLGVGVGPAREALARLETTGRVLRGEFLPGGRGEEWCDADNLRSIKQRSLARLRKQVEPVEAAALGRFLPEWHGIASPRRGPDAVLAAVERLAGAALPATDLETQILPARVADYRPAFLDELCSAGEIVWRGHGTLSQTDGRVGLYPRGHFDTLAPLPEPVEGRLAQEIERLLVQRGALFFPDIVAALGAFPRDVVEALWELVWAGRMTNDTPAPLRSRVHPPRARRRLGGSAGPRFRVSGPPGSEGRWSLLAYGSVARPSVTDRRAALTRQLLERHGVLTREAVRSEGLEGGFASIYPVLKAMEEAGRLRRGYFVAGLGATQFALPGADDRLRLAGSGADHPTPRASPRIAAQGSDSATPGDVPALGTLRIAAQGEDSATPRETQGLATLRIAAQGSDSAMPGETQALAMLRLAAVDPANPYGAALVWPGGAGRPLRAAGASVILRDGALLAWIGRGEAQLATFLPTDTLDAERAATSLVLELTAPLRAGQRAVLIAAVDGLPPGESKLAVALGEAGFRPTSRGWLLRARRDA